MHIQPTEISDVLVVEPEVLRDERGFFLETYNQREYAREGLPAAFVQDNQSSSVRGTLRGLHAQRLRPQGKLVRVLEGEIFDVAVDVRRGSPTFGKWVGVRLSAENFLQCYVPPDFLHGFVVLSDTAQVAYKVTDFYNPRDELGVRWNDPDLAIAWPIDGPLLSTKDRELPRLADVHDQLPVYRRAGGCESS